jgi:hypothetical protein
MKTLLRSFAVAAALLAVLPASAKEHKHEFKPRATLGDGKKGHAWGQFSEKVEERHISRIAMTVTRKAGGDDTFLNVRFGKDGATLDGSKREYLKSNDRAILEWRVNQKPGGKPVVVNAYNGEVFVENVVVFYDD